MNMKNIQRCFSALCLTVSIFLAIPFNNFFLWGFQPNRWLRKAFICGASVFALANFCLLCVWRTWHKIWRAFGYRRALINLASILILSCFFHLGKGRALNHGTRLLRNASELRAPVLVFAYLLLDCSWSAAQKPRSAFGSLAL